MRATVRLSAFDAIAEERIVDAMRRGEFDRLPGAGKPLDLEGDLLVPEDVRAIYRTLKNAGYVPQEVLERREIASIESMLPSLSDQDKTRALGKLALLRTRLGAHRGGRLTSQRHYARKIIEKLAGTG